MIKNKITPEIKSKFKTAITKTRETGKEHGFYLCVDQYQNLSPSDLKSGTADKLELGNSLVACDGNKIQGDFHTHAYIGFTKKMSKTSDQKMSDKQIKKLLKDTHEGYKKELGITEITIDSPSPKDLLNGALNKCVGVTKGTTCVISDIGNKVECWTAKEMIPDKCIKAYTKMYENKKERKMVEYEKWMIPLFEREIIDIE